MPESTSKDPLILFSHFASSRQLTTKFWQGGNEEWQLSIEGPLTRTIPTFICGPEVKTIADAKVELSKIALNWLEFNPPTPFTKIKELNTYLDAVAKVSSFQSTLSQEELATFQESVNTAIQARAEKLKNAEVDAFAKLLGNMTLSTTPKPKRKLDSTDDTTKAAPRKKRDKRTVRFRDTRRERAKQKNESQTAKSNLSITTRSNKDADSKAGLVDLDAIDEVLDTAGKKYFHEKSKRHRKGKCACRKRDTMRTIPEETNVLATGGMDVERRIPEDTQSQGSGSMDLESTS